MTYHILLKFIEYTNFFYFLRIYEKKKNPKKLNIFFKVMYNDEIIYNNFFFLS